MLSGKYFIRIIFFTKICVVFCCKRGCVNSLVPVSSTGQENWHSPFEIILSDDEVSFV